MPCRFSLLPLLTVLTPTTAHLERDAPINLRDVTIPPGAATQGMSTQSANLAPSITTSGVSLAFSPSPWPTGPATSSSDVDVPILSSADVGLEILSTATHRTSRFPPWVVGLFPARESSASALDTDGWTTPSPSNKFVDATTAIVFGPVVETPQANLALPSHTAASVVSASLTSASTHMEGEPSSVSTRIPVAAGGAAQVTSPADISAGDTSYALDASYNVVINSQTASAGGSPVTIGENVVSLFADGLSALVGTSTIVLAAVSTLSDVEGPLTLGNDRVLSNVAGDYVIAPGSTLAVGGPPVTIDSTVYSLKTDAVGHTVLVSGPSSGTAGDLRLQLVDATATAMASPASAGSLSTQYAISTSGRHAADSSAATSQLGLAATRINSPPTTTSTSDATSKGAIISEWAMRLLCLIGILYAGI